MATKDIDYIAKDFDSIVDALITYATVNYGTGTAGNRQWTSFNVDDFSRTWLELVAYVGDLIFFYLDVQATQSTLETATLRQAVLNIAKQFGYYVSTSTSASGTATFTLSATGNYSPTGAIPVGTRLVAQNGAEFFTTQLSNPETLVVSIPVLQGTRRTESFKARGVQNEEVILGYSSMVVDQLISTVEFISPIVKVNGDQYTLVDTFIRSLPADTHYKVSLDSSGKGTLVFGDGVFGRQLSPNDSIQVEYRTGGGTIGNIPVNTLTTLSDPLNFVISVTNLTEFSGGTDEPSIAQLKATIPYALNTIERAVTLEDYANVVLANISGVAKASADSNLVDPGTDIDVYIVPAGTSITNITDNTVLKAEIEDFLDKRKLVTTTFTLKDAYGVNVLFKLLAYLSSGASRTIVQTNISDALSEFFDFNTGDTDDKGTKFAQKIKLKDLQALISTLEGIDRFEFIRCTYRPNPIATANANYLVAPIEIFSSCDEYEWLLGADYNAASPVNNTYSVFKKINGKVTSLDANSLTDTMLNFSVLESTSTGVNTSGTSILYDSTKTFLVNEYVTNYLLVDVANNIWSISANDAHSITLSATALNDAGVSAVTSGDYKIVKSFIGKNILFNDYLYSGASAIQYNNHNTVFYVGGSFHTIGTIGDIFQISMPQTATGSFGIPATATSFTVDTPSAGFAQVQCAGDPDLSDVSDNPTDYSLVTSDLNVYNVSGADDILKTVNVLFDSSVTSVPTISSLGTPITITKPYYPDNSEICVVAGLADSESGTGIKALGTIVLDSALTKANIPDHTTFTISDVQKNIAANGAVRVYSPVTFTSEVTITTTSAHNIAVDDYVLIDGVTNDTFNCSTPFKVTAVTTYTITYEQPLLSDATSGSGTVTRITTFAFKSNSSSVTVGTRTANVIDKVSVADYMNSGNDNAVIPVIIDIGSTTNAASIKTVIINAINTQASSYTHLRIEASNGNTQMVNVTDEVVKLLNHTPGSEGNLPIVLISPAVSGLTFNGFTGGLNSGHSTPASLVIIPGNTDSVNDFGRKVSDDSIVDNIIFRTSKYLGDIANLRAYEIPELLESDIDFDLRGGVE